MNRHWTTDNHGLITLLLRLKQVNNCFKLPKSTIIAEMHMRLKLREAFCYNLAVVIDFHTHIFSPKIKQDRTHYVQNDPCFAGLYSDHRAKLATAEDIIESMDKDGVDMSVVLNIGWTNHNLCVETNDYIMESINRYPKRLIGFCSVQPAALDLALKEIERCAKGGVKGIGELRPDVQQFDFNNKEIFKLLGSEIKAHHLILLTHSSEPVGHLYQGKGGVTPDKLYSFIAGFPDIPFVCAHWGGGLPFYALMPEVKQAMSNVYFDSAASPYLYSPAIYKQVIELVGADKILYGSDYPLLRLKRFLKDIDSLNLPPDTREMILSGNAKRLLNI